MKREGGCSPPEVLFNRNQSSSLLKAPDLGQDGGGGGLKCILCPEQVLGLG